MADILIMGPIQLKMDNLVDLVVVHVMVVDLLELEIDKLTRALQHLQVHKEILVVLVQVVVVLIVSLVEVVVVPVKQVEQL